MTVTLVALAIILILAYAVYSISRNAKEEIDRYLDWRL